VLEDTEEEEQKEADQKKDESNKEDSKKEESKKDETKGEAKKEEDKKDEGKESDRHFKIIHFNDVYNLQEGDSEPCGGAARFLTALNKYRDDSTLVLFSGDIFSPSQLSTILKGEQMISFFDFAKIDVSVVGNHDLDFGLDTFIKLKEK
jgi:5'-nucleotidase